MLEENKQYSSEEIILKTQETYLENKETFEKDRKFQKERELMWVAMFCRGQKKYNNKEYKLVSQENPDVLIIDKDGNEIGFEVMEINQYSFSNEINWEDVANFIYQKKGSKSKDYGKNCYLIIPIKIPGKIDIEFTELQNRMLEIKNQGGFNFKDIYIIFFEERNKTRTISLFRDINDVDYDLI